MTTYTMKKLLNCLVREPQNHHDLEEMFREGLKEHCDDITDDKIVFTSPVDWHYKCKMYIFDENGCQSVSEQKLYNSDLAKILV